MTAEELFNALFNGGLVVMLITLVSSLGMSFGLGQLIAPLRRVWILFGMIVVNIVLGPLIAIGVAHLFPISDEARVGLAIVTIAAAGPAGLKACQLTKHADMAMAVSFVTVLLVLDMVAAPLWAEGIISGATVDPASIFVDLLILVLVPLVVGMVLRSRHPEHASGWKAGLEKASDIALYIALTAGIAVNWENIVSSVGTWVTVASTVIILAYVVLGWVVGLGDRQTAITISMVSSMRFTPIGLIVISTVLNGKSEYMTPALIFALVDTVIPFLLAAEIGRYLTRKSATPSSTPAGEAAHGV
jgi:bile acid:Na+ symporter, BASS family